MTLMDLPDRLLHKLDDRLVQLLRRQSTDAPVRVIARLSPSLVPSPAAVSPADFPSRQAYREHLIRRQREQADNLQGEALGRLRATGVAVHHSPFARSVVLEGTAATVVEALGMDVLESASVDEVISLDG